MVGHGLSFFAVAQVPYLQNSAVAVFFVLSGIVVPYGTFHKLEKDPRYSFFSYFVDRFSRIYMGLLPALVFVAGLDFLNRGLFGSAYRYSRACDLRTFVGNLFMLQDYLFQSVTIRVVADRLSVPLSWIDPVTSFGSARPLWTVAVEWWIYLLFGWVVLGATIRRTRPIFYWTFLLFFLVVPGSNWVLDGRGKGLTMMGAMGLLILALLARLQRLVQSRCGLSGRLLSDRGPCPRPVYTGRLRRSLRRAFRHLAVLCPVRPSGPGGPENPKRRRGRHRLQLEFLVHAVPGPLLGSGFSRQLARSGFGERPVWVCALEPSLHRDVRSV